jgi:hypothetical protein
MSIKPKEKKCKGTGKALGHGCGEMRLNRTYGLGHICCYRKWLLNTPEGKEKITRATLKACETRVSLEKAVKENKESKGIVAHLEKTKKAVHQMVRLRDEGKPCISCGTPWNKSFQAGHCYSANNYRSIKFDFFNINGQCEKCNLFESGNETEYLLRLPNIIGDKEFQKLKKRALNDKKFNKKWTKEELKEIREEAKQIIKQLKV